MDDVTGWVVEMSSGLERREGCAKYHFEKECGVGVCCMVSRWGTEVLMILVHFVLGVVHMSRKVV